MRILYKKAFTLAEVMITLLIIGIIASLTIPGLINSTNKAEYVTKLKKEYSVLNQAFNLIALDAGGSIVNDDNISSSIGGATTAANAMNTFATKLNIVKNCGSGMGCWYDSPLKYLDGSVWVAALDTSFNGQSGKAILADGAMMRVTINANSCAGAGQFSVDSPLYGSTCGIIFIDVNGASGPNQMGRDYFQFSITKYGIYPPEGSCDTITSTGCAKKVLAEGAMNY